MSSKVVIERLSARGESAIAVLRFGIIGPTRAALDALQRCAELYAGRPRTLPRTGMHALREVVLGPRIVEAVLIVRASATSFEVHTHGNEQLVAMHLERLHAVALACDFTVVDAREWQHAQIGEQTDTQLRRELMVMAQSAPSRIGLEACLFQFGPDGLLALRGSVDRADVERRSRLLAPFLRPSHVVLAGAVNAGKSTLFNLLVGRRRVRSGPTPGLTRDATSEVIVLTTGLPIVLTDVAGERLGAARTADGASTDSELEARAIARSHVWQERADLVLRVVDASQGDDAQFEASSARELVVATHADLLSMPHSDASASLSVSLTAGDLVETRRRIGAAITRALGAEVPDVGPAFVGPKTRSLALGEQA